MFPPTVMFSIKNTTDFSSNLGRGSRHGAVVYAGPALQPGRPTSS
jgi:hypothetical protein